MDTGLPTILLFGKGGQVGWELQRSLAPLGQLIPVDHDSQDYCGNFSDLDGIAKTVRRIRPQIIVNAAAHTAVDKAESEPDLARTINGLAPAILAKEANNLDALLVHYSTDYVFDGSGNRAWVESDLPSPLSVYGSTKLEGEQGVALANRHLIFRTSWVYAARGGNFAKTMLRLAKERDALTVIDDQIGAPTSAELLADVTTLAIREIQRNPTLGGLYHLTAKGETSWFDYARYVLEVAKGQGIDFKATEVNPIKTQSYPTPARRPLNSRLNLEKIEMALNIKIPNWEIGVKRMLMEILPV